ncbi:hypothetical protein D3C85_1622920 [compost metagenome]
MRDISKIKIFLITQKYPLFIPSVKLVAKLYHVMKRIVHYGQLDTKAVFIMVKIDFFGKARIFF